MEKNKGFFTALKEEVVRGLSPGRSRTRTPKQGRSQPEPVMSRSGSMELPLSPLREGPDPNDPTAESKAERWGHWMKGHWCRPPEGSGSGSGAYQRSDLRLLLGVLGAPLAPVDVSNLEPFPHLSIKDTPIETSSAQYILQQYMAACGRQKVQNSIHNAYAMGKVKMLAFDIETATKVIKNRNSSRTAESGSFVLWQMNPDMWYVELALGASKVHAGCNGQLVWRHTPWLGAHAAKGPVRPLRRALQGLDPRTTASMFANARCTGEKKINDEDCFILKLCADPHTLKARSEGPAEIIRHVLFGYFSQKTGLLVHLEDSHLTRIQTNGGDAVYWETTINSFLEDYRPVEGVMIAHSGQSVVTLFRFGETAMSHTKTRMQEAWTIEEVAFNGLDPRTTASMFANARCTGEKKINDEDCFILKLCADPHTLKARSEGPAEIIRHVLFGYFSQKTGLLVHLEDSHLTRIQTNGGDAVYWETTINSFLEDYRPVEGVMIAHSGQSVVTLFRFGETAMSHTKTRMQEAWTIEEVAFNVPGLSVDCFIPPAELRFADVSDESEYRREDRVKTAGYRAKVEALERSVMGRVVMPG